MEDNEILLSQDELDFVLGSSKSTMKKLNSPIISKDISENM